METSYEDKTGLFPSLRVCDMGEDQRPRERMLRHGPKALSDAELLAILLASSGLPGLSVVDLARNMLADARNDLVAFAKMPIKELTRRFKGVGEAKAITVAAAFELGERLEQARRQQAADKHLTVRSSDDAYQYIRHRLEMLDHEEFWVIALARNLRIKTAWCVSRGGLAATVVDSRMILRDAINELASSLILVHNHPSGNLSPSPQDDDITRRIKEGAAILDIQVTDHLIIAAGSYYSYADNSRL